MYYVTIINAIYADLPEQLLLLLIVPSPTSADPALPALLGAYLL